MSDPVTLNPLDAAMAALKDAQAITRKCERDVWSAVACVGLDAKDRARTAEAERDAALADVTAWRGFAGSVAVAVHPDGTGDVIADHLAVDDLPDLLAAVERVVGDVARLRAVIASAADDLPLHPEGAPLTPAEDDGEEVRFYLLAALRGEA
jgi:hypothetical protein